MNDTQFAELTAWIAAAGLAGEAEPDLLAGFCERLVAAGLPITRAQALIDTLHPVYEGRVFSWHATEGKATPREYGSSSEGEAAQRWLASPFYRLVQSGESLLRRRVDAQSVAEFPILAENAAGMSDYVAMAQRLTGAGIIGEMDCVYSSWATDRPDGFGDADIADLAKS